MSTVPGQAEAKPGLLEGQQRVQDQKLQQRAQGTTSAPVHVTSASDATSGQSSHSKSRSQDEKGETSDDPGSAITSPVGGESRKTKTAVKEIQEGMQEHAKKGESS